MEKYDFLFIYEHKVRELENICLMKYELDKRGYKTKIIYINDKSNALEVRPIYHTRVMCTMACYDNSTLRWHAKDYIKFDKVIDLQWENIVYPKDEEREDAYKNYSGIGKDVAHVSWGTQNVNRLLNAAHLDEKNVLLSGHVGMDFLRTPLNRYYTSREELFAKYDLPVDKKVILFASPFYGDCLSDEYIAKMCNDFGDDWPDYYKFMCDSQDILLEWFEEYCVSNPDIIFVFRPHPGHPSMAALELEKKITNFRVISGESVKQWIVSCDKIYTGNSSVVVEAFFAQKMCQLLFPIPTTPGFELLLISDSRKITTKEGFLESVNATEEIFPTSQESIEQIYLVDWDRYSFQRFADNAEKVYKDDSYTLSKAKQKEFREYSTGQKLIHWIYGMKPIYSIYLALVNNEKLHWSFLENQRKIREETLDFQNEYEKTHAHELTSDEEIQKIIDRIKYALEG